MNTSHSAIKRLLNEYKDFTKSPSSVIHAAPISQSNLFEWHFTIRGPIESPFEGGIYHGRVLLPTEYPYKPPDVMLLTPNGRFECHKKICLNLTSFHKESWHPGCSIRTLLLSLRMFFLEEEKGVGSIQYNDKERAALARESHSWHCEKCGCTMKEIEFAEGNEADEQKLESRMQSTAEQEEKQASTEQSTSTAAVSSLQVKTTSTDANSTSSSALLNDEPAEEHTPVTPQVLDALAASLLNLPQERQQQSRVQRRDDNAATISPAATAPAMAGPQQVARQVVAPQPAAQSAAQPRNTPQPRILLQQQAHQKDWDQTAMQMINFLLTGTAIGIMALLWQKLLV